VNDSKGRPFGYGDTVSFAVYPKGRARGTVVRSAVRWEATRAGEPVEPFCVEVDGKRYGPLSETQVLRIGKHATMPASPAEEKGVGNES
jgi:hypothetical protein